MIYHQIGGVCRDINGAVVKFATTYPDGYLVEEPEQEPPADYDDEAFDDYYAASTGCPTNLGSRDYDAAGERADRAMGE